MEAPVEGEDADVERGEVPDEPPVEEELLLGSMGGLLRNSFKDFFENVAVDTVNGSLNFSEEDNIIAKAQKQLDADTKRLAELRDYLNEQTEKAEEDDKDIAEYLQSQKLTIKDDFPVGESMLQLDTEVMHAENLIVPRELMSKFERRTRIQQGIEQKHPNRFAHAKPEQPNYLKLTPALVIRQAARGIVPRLSDEQREALKKIAKPRRKRPVAFFSLPRVQPEQGTAEKGQSCPFRVTPSPVIFRNYEVGGVYEIVVEVLNWTAKGRRVRVKPLNSSILSYELKYRGPSVVAPGMATYVHVRFMPKDLNDVHVALTLQTEMGDFNFPVRAIRDPPKLESKETILCGCVLAGGYSTTHTATFANRGGEAAFRIFHSENDDDYHYDEEPDGTMALNLGPFRISPVSFYLMRDDEVKVSVEFIGVEEDIDVVSRKLAIECDSGEVTHVTVTGICDGLRCELVEWKGRPLAPPEMVPEFWTMVQPWRLFWRSQVREERVENVVIGNGSHLPLTLRWVFVCPPDSVLRDLATGTLPFLSAEILDNITSWQESSDSFAVTPCSTCVDPFSTHSFAFAFRAPPPIGRKCTVFALLYAVNLPTKDTIENASEKQSLRRALVPFDDALRLQKKLKPTEGYTHYACGVPLSANRLVDLRVSPSAVADTVAREGTPPPIATATTTPSCLFSAFCLQGTTLAPDIRVTPPAVTFPGTILPYVPHCTKFTLTNTSQEFPTTFSVRTLRTDNWDTCDMFKPIMVVSEADIGEGPSTDNLLPPLLDVGKKDDVTRRDRWGEYLDDKTIWPPLPPTVCGDQPHPGHGALATVLIRPSTGTLEPGQSLTLELVFRCRQATDIDALIQIDLDDACEPIHFRLSVAVRAPMVEVQDAALLDYGIVRAHASHTLGFTLRNPSNLPCLAYVEYAKDRQEVSRIPGFCTYSSICDHYLDSRNEPKDHPLMADVSPTHYSDRETTTISSETRMQSDTRRQSTNTQKSDENGVHSWVCALCGCRDTSGRPGPLQRDVLDQVFDIAPWFIVPPQGTTRVEVTFRARHVERFRAFLEVHVFDSPEIFSIEVLAEVQLPVVTISRGHLIYPVTYLKRPSQALTFEMCNESDMEARFDWKHQDFTQTCLEAQLNPTSGCVPPRGSLEVNAVVVPMSSNAEGIGRAEMKVHVEGRILSIPLLLTAHIFPVEVDGAILAPGQEEPTVAFIPRAMDANPPTGVFRFDSESEIPTLDLGSIEVQTTKTMKILMYNRSGIETPFSVRMQKYPHFDPLRKGRKVSQAVLAIAQKQTTLADEESVCTRKLIHENKPAARHDAQVRKKNLLSDGHETQAFRSKDGADFAASKLAASTGSSALNYGFGWALKLFPAAGWIAAYGTACVECTAYSDLPGVMEDLIRVEIRELPTVHIPARFESTGSPLYLPPLQVSLYTDATPPILDCGSLVIAERQVTRRFKLANSSESGIVVKWRAYPADAVDDLNRPLLQFGLKADGTFGATAIPPTAVDPLAVDGCCPISVDPPSGILRRKSETSFTVTLTAKIPGVYHYKLIGFAYLQHERRTAEDDDFDGAKSEENSKLSSSDPKKATRAAGVSEQQKEVVAVHQLPSVLCVDSDDEEQAATLEATTEPAPPTRAEEEWPLSTTVIDVRGECITPKLTIDKMIHEPYGMPVVKYYKASVSDPDIRRAADPRFAGMAPGTVVVGGGLADPARGIVAARVRGIMFVNEHRCPIYTRIRVDSGPFKICRVEKVTDWPQKKSADGIFTKVIDWKQHLEVWVEFEPPHWSKWEGHEHTYTGELVVEYPHDQTDPSSVIHEESQKVKLVAVCRKPKLTIDLVTIAEPYSVRRPISEDVLVVEFFRVHVQALIEVKRRIVLRNETNVLAHWKVFHVERKVGRRASESDSLDHGDAFVFGQSEGTLYGPSLPYRCLPLGPALEHYLPHDDTDEYRPLFIQVAFHPKKDAEYMSRFRFQVQGGASVDIICHGHGSYREEDDIMELVEA